MFQDSLMESVAHSPARRGRMTLIGMGVQLTPLSSLLLYPLMHPEVMPQVLAAHKPIPLISPAPAPAPQPLNVASGASNTLPAVVNRTLTAPPSIPSHTYSGPDTAPPQIYAGANACQANCLPAGIAGAGNGAAPVLATAKPRVISHLDEGQIISRVQPVYPAIARATRTEGTVV